MERCRGTLAGRDLSARPETEQLLSGRARDDAPSVHLCPRPVEQRSTAEPYFQSGGGGVSSTTSRPTTRDKSTGLSRNARLGGPSGNPVAVITPPSIIVNGTVENDDPPPYSPIAPPNHAGWSYDLFSFGDSYPTSAPPYRVEIPLAPLQDSLTPAATGFHPEGTDGQHAPLPTPLTPYRFFKYGWRASSLAPRETSFPDNRIAEKIDDKKSRRYGAILVAAAVIVFLMVLSLMVRFIMERSWWRR